MGSLEVGDGRNDSVKYIIIAHSPAVIWVNTPQGEIPPVIVQAVGEFASIGRPSLGRGINEVCQEDHGSFSYVRQVLHNVKRWQTNNSQAQRWIAAASLQMQRRFRRVRGCKSMSILINGLEEEALKKGTSHKTKAA